MWAVGSTDDTEGLSRWGQLKLTAEIVIRHSSYVICQVGAGVVAWHTLFGGLEL
jgi:hypothetical protein